MAKRDLEDEALLYEGIPFDDETYGLGEEEAAETYTFAGDIIEQLRGLGMSDRDRPQLQKEHEGIFRGMEAGDYFDGRLPVVLKHLSLDQVSALHTLFSAWYAYVSAELNRIIVQRQEAGAQKELMWSMVRMKHLKTAKKIGVNLTDQRLSDLARYDERFTEANSKYLRLNCLKECVESLQKVAERDTKTVSREVAVRDIQATHEARGRGIHGPSTFEMDKYHGAAGNMRAQGKRAVRRADSGTPKETEEAERPAKRRVKPFAPKKSKSKSKPKIRI